VKSHIRRLGDEGVHVVNRVLPLVLPVQLHIAGLARLQIHISLLLEHLERSPFEPLLHLPIGWYPLHGVPVGINKPLTPIGRPKEYSEHPIPCPATLSANVEIPILHHLE